MKKFLAITIGIFLSVSVTAQSYRGTRNIQTHEQQLNEQYCTGFFKTTEGTIIEVASSISAQGYLNILDWLNGRVAGLQVYTNRAGIRIPVIRGTIAGVYIDEIPVSAGMLASLSTNDIAIIKVIKTPFYGGFNGGGGAIAIYTLKGGEEEEEEE